MIWVGFWFDLYHVEVMSPMGPRLKPSVDPVILDGMGNVVLIPLLPLPALATWSRLSVVRFYRQHQDIKQDLVKNRKLGICTIRFQRHCERIPYRIRKLHDIQILKECFVVSNSNGKSQALVCERIDQLLSCAMMFWGFDSTP